MRQTDVIYTINEDYHIEIRVRKCHNVFRLRLMNKNNERLEEICCPQNMYIKSIESLIELTNNI